MSALREFLALVECYVTDERTEMKLAADDRKTLG
jgi:hypothetical protein